MAAAAITLEALPAAFGDCLLISCPVGTGVWRLLIDTGPDETYAALRRRLLEIPKNAQGKRHIDLFVVTHIDHDHIGGARLLLDDSELELSLGDIWFNAPPSPQTRGVAEGERLAQLLGATKAALSWNSAWSAKAVSTPAAGGGVELSGKGLPKITVLSPTPERLQELYKVWTKELDRLRRKVRDKPQVEPAPRGSVPTIEQLAARMTATDSATPNGSSIAFLLEHRGASLLLGADAFPTVLVPAIQALASRRELPGYIEVDAFKLSHHGSRASVTANLLAVVRAKHYVVSTNNSYFSHPDDEAMAQVITLGQQPTIWFNYDTPKNRKWADEALTKRYGHRVRYPEREGTGVRLELPARRRVSTR